MGVHTSKRWVKTRLSDETSICCESPFWNKSHDDWIVPCSLHEWVGQHKIPSTKTTLAEKDWDWIPTRDRWVDRWFSEFIRSPNRTTKDDLTWSEVIRPVIYEKQTDASWREFKLWTRVRAKIADKFGYVLSVNNAFKLIAEFETRSTTKSLIFLL